MKNSLKQKGVAAVELALLLIPLVLLVFGITELGRAIYQYNTIVKGVRDGTRYLTQYEPGNSSRIEEAKSLVVFGIISSNCNQITLVPLVPGLKCEMVTVKDRLTSTDKAAYDHQKTGKGVVNLVGVEVNGFGFSSLAPFFISNFTFDPIQTTMVQVL